MHVTNANQTTTDDREGVDFGYNNLSVLLYTNSGVVGFTLINIRRVWRAEQKKTWKETHYKERKKETSPELAIKPPGRLIRCRRRHM